MKKTFILFCCAAIMFGAPQTGSSQAPVPTATVALDQAVISVSAEYNQDGDLVITCTSQTDGMGILQVQDQEGNYLINRQIGLVNGQYVEVFAAKGGAYKSKFIHFHMNGGIAETTLP
ncbi:MAG: hypothetical protein WCG55_01425 [bacterium]